MARRKIDTDEAVVDYFIQKDTDGQRHLLEKLQTARKSAIAALKRAGVPTDPPPAEEPKPQRKPRSGKPAAPDQAVAT